MKQSKFIIFFLLLSMLLYGCARSEYTVYSQVQEAYQKIQTNSMTDEEAYAAYAELFASIANGARTEQDRFAELVREITKDDVVFENEEVFIIAQDYASVFSRFASGDHDDGVQELKVQSISESTAQLEFSYWGRIWYSVEMLSEGEDWGTGEFTEPYKGELGQYLLAVTFHDAEPTMQLLEKYPSNTDHKLHVPCGGSVHEMSMRIIFNADHGYNVYIGSDVPFQVEEQSSVILNRLIGTVSVALNFEL